MPKAPSASSTRKAKADRSPKRRVIPRGLPPTPGVMNILVVKSGRELHENLQTRLEAMKLGYEKVEFFWTKLVNDPSFNETREYPELSQVVRNWELAEGVKDFLEYKTKMKRLKALLDHFQPDCDYELTVAEAAEVLS